MSTPASSSTSTSSSTAAPASRANRSPGSTTPRKLAYLVGIVAIFVVMVPFNQWFQEIKTNKYKLDNAALGSIDSDSFMLKVAQLCGARGVAANVLWMQSIDLQKRHEWDRMGATVNRITTLQPHFLTVWSFQGWNLAYNVSVEWDAPEDKYSWIKKGIQFLKRGVSKNRTSPDLIWHTAWTYYHKLGYADEAIILRRLYADEPEAETTEEDFQTVTYVDPSVGGRDEITDRYDDNFQMARAWFYKAINLVDNGEDRLFATASGDDVNLEFVDEMKRSKGRPNDLNFFAHPAQSQAKYAASLEKSSVLGREATFGDPPIIQWEQAQRDWEYVGQRSFEVPNEMDEDGDGQIDRLMLGLSVVPEERNNLMPNQKYWVNRWANQLNYPYWWDRCRIERTRAGVEARRHFYNGSIHMRLGEFREAASEYLQGLELWQDLMDDHPDYAEDPMGETDNGELAKRYIRAYQQWKPGESIPESTPFLEESEMISDDLNLDPFDALDMGLIDIEDLRQSLRSARQADDEN